MFLWKVISLKLNLQLLQKLITLVLKKKVKWSKIYVLVGSYFFGTKFTTLAKIDYFSLKEKVKWNKIYGLVESYFFGAKFIIPAKLDYFGLKKKSPQVKQNLYL